MITNKDISIDSENGKITLNGNKYDLGTQGEIDTAVKDVYSVIGQNGAKNLIPYPYYRASGYSSNGMTTTYDSDGVLTINKVAGSSTAFLSLIVNDQDYCFKPNTKYKLLFELENANQLSIYLKYGDTDIVLINKKSTGKYVVDFTTPQTLQGRENLALNAAARDTETNAKVKVMIMLASDTDDTYQPYAMTNKQLTDQLGTKQDTLTFDTTPTDASTNPVESGGVYNALNTIDSAKADVFKSQSADTSQSINVGTPAAPANRMFLLSSGYQGTYVFGLVFISSINNIEYVDISHKDTTVSSISYNDGVVSITLSSATYTPARLIRLC